MPITIFLYLIAGRYILGNNKFSGLTTKLSGVTKGLTSGILSDPNKMENIIGLVRTAAPLTSAQTVSKVNTYLPIFEKVSTLLGMYTFLNRAQNYAPIQPLSAKTPMEKVTALISNGNLPIGKMLAQPLIANNMDKIISSVAKEVVGPMIKSGNLNDIISTMSKQFSNENAPKGNNGSDSDNSNLDIGSLLEVFMPLMNNFMSDNSSVSDSSTFTNATTQSNEEPKATINNTLIHNDHIPDLSNNANEPINKMDQPAHEESNNTPLEIKPRNRKRRYY